MAQKKRSDDFLPTRVGTELSNRSPAEISREEKLKEIYLGLLESFGPKWNRESILILRRSTISRILFLDKLYQSILQVPGVICEFGVQWGSTLSALINLRGIYEPYNHSRVIFGFDTFSGFSAIDPKDGEVPRVGDYSVVSDYEGTLNKILQLQESFSPGNGRDRFRLYKGDASIQVNRWDEENPHAIIALAMFDMDVYRPTKDVLQKILPRLAKGSVLYFDELNCTEFPGETVAVQEVLGFSNLRLKQDPNQPFAAWAVYGD
jgi:Macrocin-O-methyltransferase (TylF)